MPKFFLDGGDPTNPLEVRTILRATRLVLKTFDQIRESRIPGHYAYIEMDLSQRESRFRRWMAKSHVDNPADWMDDLLCYKYRRSQNVVIRRLRALWRETQEIRDQVFTLCAREASPSAHTGQTIGDTVNFRQWDYLQNHLEDTTEVITDDPEAQEQYWRNRPEEMDTSTDSEAYYYSENEHKDLDE